MLKILPSSLLWHDIVGRERCYVLSLTQQLRSENENEKLEKCFFHVAALSSKLSEKSVAWKQRVCTEKLKWKLFEWEFYSFVLFLPPPPSAPSSSSSSMMKLKRSLHESSEVRRVTSQTMWTNFFFHVFDMLSFRVFMCRKLQLSHPSGGHVEGVGRTRVRSTWTKEKVVVSVGKWTRCWNLLWYHDNPISGGAEIEFKLKVFIFRNLLEFCCEMCWGEEERERTGKGWARERIFQRFQVPGSYFLFTQMDLCLLRFWINWKMEIYFLTCWNCSTSSSLLSERAFIVLVKGIQIWFSGFSKRKIVLRTHFNSIHQREISEFFNWNN